MCCNIDENKNLVGLIEALFGRWNFTITRQYYIMKVL